MKKYAIIVAGGSGTRFGSTLPKQFIPLGGVPVLMRTIKAFADYDPDINIVVALPSEHLTLWGDLCASRNFDVPHKVVGRRSKPLRVGAQRPVCHQRDRMPCRRARRSASACQPTGDCRRLRNSGTVWHGYSHSARHRQHTPA